MGSNQSSSHIVDDDQHRITVVNPNPSQEQTTTRKALPARVPPILSVDGHNIDPERHKQQLDYHIWVEFAATVNQFSNSRADLVSTRQSQLQEKIIQVDDFVQMFTDKYIQDNHPALARLNADCKKVQEFEGFLQKLTIKSEICLDMIRNLNLLLPEEHKLEEIQEIS